MEIYKVTITDSRVTVMEIDADSREEAEEMARYCYDGATVIPGMYSYDKVRFKARNTSL